MVSLLPQTQPATFDSRGSNVWFVLGCALLFVALAIRFSWYPVVVSDYTYFGKPWFDTLHVHPGLSAFSEPFADYAPLYLYLLKFLTLLPFSSLASEKTLSLVGDLLIACFAYLILGRVFRNPHSQSVRVMAAAVLFSLPTVMINSSLWGQTDALYAAAVMASLFFMLADAPLAAAFAFGIAFALKQQAIFFAPVLVGYLLRKRRTWLYLLMPPAMFVLTVIPPLIAGGPGGYWLFIYLHQAGEYPWLSVSAQSLFAFLQPLALPGSVTSIAFWTGMLSAAAISLWVVYRIMRREHLTPEWLVLMSMASALLLPYVLPRMHERYFYLADILSVLYAFSMPRRFFVPILVVGASLISYMPFLAKQVSFLSFAQGVDLRIPAALLLIPICLVFWDIRRSRIHPFPG